MRILLPVAAALLLALVLPAPAEAQLTHSQLTIAMDAPESALTHESEIVRLVGTTTFTGDIGQYQNTNGVPISYTVTKSPAWLLATVSPSSDVIPLPPIPQGAAVTMVRPFEVALILAPDYIGKAIDQVEITVTQGAVTGGSPASARSAVPVMVDAGKEKPCPDHAVTDEQLAQWAATAAEAYEDYEASRPEEDADEVSVQGVGASPIALPAIGIAGFALVGAGVGLLLRKRFR